MRSAKQEENKKLVKPGSVAGMSRAALSDVAALRGALKNADIVPQLLVQAQLSGDLSLLDEAQPYIKGAWSYQHDLPEDLRDKITEALIAALKASAGSADSPPLSKDRFGRLMSGGVGKPVPDDYVAMMMEEMTSDETDGRMVGWRKKVNPEALGAFKVVIAGAGLSGICMGIKLKEAGIPFAIYEKNADLGGTWFENTYPGCAVDIPNHFYSFSFALKNDWSRHFARQEELWSYLKDCVEKFNIRENIHFGHMVESAEYDSTAARWTVGVKAADGATETVEANVFVAGVGQLNRPLIPSISGLSDFEGPVIHTAQWDHSVDLKGKRVALVGTGASSMQVAPAVAADVDRLIILQRTPCWANPNPNYHLEVTDGMIWALENIPFFARWHRVLLSWASGDGFHAMLQVDDDWHLPKLSLNAENHRFRESLIAHITSQIGDRPDLMAKAIPSYPPYGKRMLRDNNWYKTLRRDNVDLIDSGANSITSDSVIDRHGTAHKVDMIVLATGFQTTQMLAPMDIRGLRGKTIRNVWGDEDPRAYLGITVPGFPNFFVLFGPNTALSHGGSLFFHAECQVRYVMQCIREMIEGDYAAMECRTNPFNDYNRRVDEAHRRMVWAHPGMTNWYKNSAGRVVTNSPWRMVDYWNLTYALNPADYILTPREN